MKEHKERLEQEISSCDFWDLQTWNGENKPSAPFYSLEEQKYLKEKKVQLQKQLHYLERGIFLN